LQFGRFYGETSVWNAFCFVALFYKKYSKILFITAFDRAKSVENASLIRRGGWSGHNEKASMHFTIEKCSFGGRLRFAILGSAAPKMHVLFIFPRRPFFLSSASQSFFKLL